MHRKAINSLCCAGMSIAYTRFWPDAPDHTVAGTLHQNHFLSSCSTCGIHILIRAPSLKPSPRFPIFTNLSNLSTIYQTLLNPFDSSCMWLPDQTDYVKQQCVHTRWPYVAARVNYRVTAYVIQRRVSTAKSARFVVVDSSLMSNILAPKTSYPPVSTQLTSRITLGFELRGSEPLATAVQPDDLILLRSSSCVPAPIPS